MAETGGKGRALLPVVLGAGLVIALGLSAMTLQRARTREARWAATVDSLERRLSATRDSLGSGRSRHAAELESARRASGLDEAQLDALRRQGLRDPVRDLREDLKAHPELIPYPGVLGGRMGFYNDDAIRILSERWVLARFDDGHVDGSMLLEYRIRNGRILWRRLAAMIH